MFSSPIVSRHQKAPKIIGITLTSLALSFGMVAAAATASGAAAPATTKALPAPQCASCSAGRAGSAAVFSSARTISTSTRKTHGVRPLATVDENNWAGYVATGKAYTAVYGKWIVPTAHCGALENSASVTFVGLGIGTGTTEQIGTESACVNGVPTYSVWENPQYQVSATSEVSAGQQMIAGVCSESASYAPPQGGSCFNLSGTGTNYSVFLNDDGSPASETPIWSLVGGRAGSPAALASAEWITSRPSGYSALTNFGTVDFTGADATDAAGASLPVFGFPNTQVWMNDGAMEAVATGLSANGSSFDDVWLHS
jgi:Peptidase A4 family